MCIDFTRHSLLIPRKSGHWEGESFDGGQGAQGGHGPGPSGARRATAVGRAPGSAVSEIVGLSQERQVVSTGKSTNAKALLTGK